MMNFNLKLNISQVLDFIMMFTLAFLFLSRGFFSTIADLFIWFLGFMYFIKYYMGKEVQISLYIGIGYITLMMYFFLNAWINESYDFKIIYYFLIMIPLYFIFSSGDRRIFYFVYSLGLILSTIFVFSIIHLLGILDFSFMFYVRDGGIRASGLMYNPNYFAYSTFISFLLLDLFLPKSKIKIWFMLPIFLLILLSFSRGVSLGLLVYVIIKLLSLSVLLKSLLFVCLVFIFSKFVDVNISFDELYSTLEYRIENLKSGDVSGRSDVWRIGFQVWSKDIEDILLGFGFNQFIQNTASYGVDNTVHNSYLRLLYEFGIIGFMIVMQFFILCICYVRSVSMQKKLIVCFVVLLTWFSNDFFINKDTFFLLICLMVANTVNKVSLLGMNIHDR